MACHNDPATEGEIDHERTIDPWYSLVEEHNLLGGHRERDRGHDRTGEGGLATAPLPTLDQARDK